MSNTGIIIGLILALICGVAVALPFFTRRAQPIDNADLAAHQLHYERILTNLRDLDDDYALGKVTESFYADERKKLLSAGIVMLQELENLRGQSATVTDDLDQQIEVAIAKHRQGEAA